MTKISDYRSLFYDRILERAPAYANPDKIELMEAKEGLIRARIFGTHPYDTRIKLEGEKILEMNCSCPFDWGYCKHLAALIMYWQKEDIPMMIKEKSRPKIPLEKLLQKTTKKVLVSKIVEFADKDPEFESLFRLSLEQPKATDGPEYYQRFVAQYLKKFTGEYGILQWNRLHEITDYFIKQLNILHKEKQYDQLIFLSTEIIRQINTHLLHTDDSYGHLGGLLEEAFHKLDQIRYEAKYTKAHRALLWERLMWLLEDEDIFAFDCGYDSWEVLSKLVENREDYDDFVRTMESTLKEDSDPDDFIHNFQKDQIIQYSLQALECFAACDEVWEFMREHRAIPAIRHRLIELHMDAGEYEEAEDIIEEGVILADLMESPGQARDWESYHLKIALRKGDEDGILHWARYLLLEHTFDMELFELIKEYTPQKEWAAKRDELIEQLIKNESISSNSRLIEIYAKEELYDRLVEALEDKGIDFYTLNHYADRLLPQYRDELVQLYIKRIRRFIYVKVGRKYYRVAARQIRKLHDWGASDQARELTESLREEYSHRPAMLEEFEGL